MEFGKILIAQITSFISLYVTIIIIESSCFSRFYSVIYKNAFLNISDEKGLFMFFFLAYLISVVSFLEILRNVNEKDFKLRDKIVYVQACNFNNSIILFTNFLSLYICKKLDFKTLNLLMLGVINSVLYNFSYIMNLKLLSSLFYCTFIISNIVNLLITYILGFDRILNSITIFYKKYKTFN